MAYYPISKKFLLTGGIGDVLALESFFSDEQRRATEAIYYGTRAHRVIRQIFESLPNYPNLKRHIILWEDFSKRFAFHNMNEIIEQINPHTGTTEADWNLRIANYQRWTNLLNNVADYSISVVFPKCNDYFRPYNKSSVLMHKVADISRFCLPGNAEFLQRSENQHRLAWLTAAGCPTDPLSFIIVCPYTINDRRDSGRDFQHNEWNFLKNYLESRKCFAVVLNIGDDPIPEHPLIINLANQTTFLESIEVLKQGKGYIGIDSSLSVLAPKIFDPSTVIIKSLNGHCYLWAPVYYAPYQNTPFLMRGFHGA